ncbi:PPOX class F420-dependent oxidoreductase [Cumulibacter manganitolerans]|uniref:PPOX class F420-dependent oxidoreductase n=1 Tax=Cumulibacter manganitolerans TaxID=1884992 RepID=UPI001296771D|nr:PPOX class F420-dependent oxidoreductase [Cumulibacter manganitolerans]
MTIAPQLSKVFESNRLATLATIRRDGRPQLSQVSYAYDAPTATFRISVTDGRAKTKNLRRDPRATLLVQDDSPWVYAVADGDASLGPVTTQPGDPGSEQLVALYRDIAGEHPDWDDYRRAMVAEQRLVLTVVAGHAYGLGG